MEGWRRGGEREGKTAQTISIILSGIVFFFFLLTKVASLCKKKKKKKQDGT